MVLSDGKINKKYKILSVNNKEGQKKRLMDMGITVNAEAEFIRTAPLGDPIEIKIRGFHVALRKADASLIEVLEVE